MMLPRLLFAFLSLLPLAAGADDAPPALTAEEQAAGWKLLFDGQTFTNWRGLGRDDVPGCWVIQDGCLKCKGGNKENPACDLVTVEVYENFEFAFEWAFPKTKGNSGVKYRVQEKAGQGYAFGPEYQCWSDPDKVDEHSSGALYDLFAPSEKKQVAKGEFNQSKIVVRGNLWEHWLNGAKVVDAEFGSETMQAALAKSYFKKSDWGREPRGRIALQNHRSEVLYRNLKIRVLAAEAVSPSPAESP